MKVVFDTNMQFAYSQGKYKQQKLISDLYPFWKYSQIERATKRHDHSLLNGKVFRHDDPIWKKIYPPSGFGCKCSVVPIKDDSKLENGSKFLDILNNSNDFQLKPLEALEPDTSKYVEGIRVKLESLLNKITSSLYDKIMLAEDDSLMKSINEEYLKSTNEDLGHKKLAELQKFTEKPTVKSQTEIDLLNKNDYYTSYRGLNELKFYDDFKYGDYFSGKGIFGSGTYTGIDDLDIARGFTSQQEVLKILFPKNANIIKYKELENKFINLYDEYRDLAYKKLGYKINEEDLITQELSKNASKLSEKEQNALIEKYKEIRQNVDETFKNLRKNARFLNDIGNYATCLGFDAILIEDRNYLLIMNRTKCIVQKENVELKNEFNQSLEFSENTMNATLSRRLGLIWNKIPLYNNIEPQELYSLSLKISYINDFNDLPEIIKEYVFKTEKILGIKHD